MDVPTWTADLTWPKSLRDAIVVALQAYEPFTQRLGKGKLRTFDEPLIQRDDVAAADCPLCALYCTNFDLGMIGAEKPEDDKATLGAFFATADASQANHEELVLAFRAAIAAAWATVAQLRGGSLMCIQFLAASPSRTPAKEAAEPLWATELPFVVTFRPPN